MKQRSSQQIAMHVSRVTIFWNTALTAFKLAAGVAAGSGAMVSDAVHSASDVLSTLVVMIGVKAAGKAADKSHPYGHERMECVAAVLLAVILFLTGAGIGLAGIRKIVIGDAGGLRAPGALALAAAGVSIAVKETMYWYTRAAAKKTGYGALLADAWHHRSDALSSVGSFAGILGARLGHPVLDPAAGIVICALIIKTAAGIFADAVNKMTDRACDDGMVDRLSREINNQTGVMGIDAISTRLFGDRVYVDVEIRAQGELSLNEAHGIAENVHLMVERKFPEVKHCMVHVNPG